MALVPVHYFKLAGVFGVVIRPVALHTYLWYLFNLSLNFPSRRWGSEVASAPHLVLTSSMLLLNFLLNTDVDDLVFCDMIW